MTTVNQILTAKEAGDDSEYKHQLNMARNAADALDKAEEEAKRLKKGFEKVSDLVTELTGCQLWHTDDGDKFFWRKGGDISKHFPTRATALHALATDSVEWA